MPNTLTKKTKNTAIPKERSSGYFKKLLKEGRLISQVKFYGEKVYFHFYSPYNNEICWNPIMRSLKEVYDGCEEFQNKFEFPPQTAEYKWVFPILYLKPKHGYHSEQGVKNALALFAKRQPKWAFTTKLRNGEALSRVTVQPDGKVILHLKPFYDRSIYYLKINKAFYYLYLNSPYFKAHFETPKKNNQTPVLQLKKREIYPSNQAALEMIINASKEIVNKTPLEKASTIHLSNDGWTQEHVDTQSETSIENASAEEWIGEIELLDAVEEHIDTQSETSIENASAQEPHFLMKSSELLGLFQEELENNNNQEESFLLRSSELLNLYKKEIHRTNTSSLPQPIQQTTAENTENQDVKFLMNSAELLDLFKLDASESGIRLSL